MGSEIIEGREQSTRIYHDYGQEFEFCREHPEFYQLVRVMKLAQKVELNKKFMA